MLRLLGPALLIVVVPVTAAGQDARVEARVVDASTGAPVPGADVILRALGGRAELRTVSGEDGGFVIAPLLPVRYTLRIERLGYRTRLDTLALAPGAVLDLRLALAPAPVPLPGVAAAGRPQPPPGPMSAFWERRQRNLGDFLTREDIERIRPMRTADILRAVPGTRIQNVGYGQVAIFDRVRNMGGGLCVPAMFVNGVPYVMTDRGLDDFSPGEIEAVEVYAGAARVPAELNAPGRPGASGRRDGPINGSPRCGAIVIWLRRGD